MSAVRQPLLGQAVVFGVEANLYSASAPGHLLLGEGQGRAGGTGGAGRGPGEAG